MEKVITHVFLDTFTVADHVAQHVLKRAKVYIEETGSCIIGLSGGSTPDTILQLWAKAPYVEEMPWDKLYFVWVDERVVSVEDANSNYGKAKRLLFSKVPTAHVFPMITDVGSVDDLATKYEKTLDVVFKTCCKDSIDIMLLGLGEDGHTASLFPKSKALQAWSTKVVAVKDGVSWQRVSLTLPCIMAAKERYFVVTGEKKSPAYKTVCQQMEEYQALSWQERMDKVLPAAILPIQGTTFYMDVAAYGDRHT